MAEVVQFIDGLSDLEKALQELPVKVHRNVLRGALRAAGKPILDAAKANAPVASGALRDSIRLSFVRADDGKTVAYAVKAGPKGRRDKGGAFYAHMVEFGTAAHTIKARNGKTLFNVAGGLVIGPRVEHPGAAAKPFMRPAADSAMGLAIEAFAAYSRKRIDRMAKKQGAK